MAVNDGERAPDPLSVLQLLVEEAPLEAYEALLRQLGPESGDAERQRLNQAVRFAYLVNAHQGRRRQRESGLAELVETARDITQPHGMTELLNVITRRLRRIINADLAYICLHDEDGNLNLRAIEGTTTAITPGTPVADGLGRRAISLGAPLWTADYPRDTEAERDTRGEEFLCAEGITSLLAVPLILGDSALGVVCCASRGPRRLTPDEIGLVCSLAALGAVAIERAERISDARSEVTALELDSFRARTVMGRLEHLGEAHGRMLSLLLSVADLATVVRAAGDALDSVVQLRDPAGRVMAATAELPDLDDDALAKSSWAAHAGRTVVAHDESTLVAPVVAGAENLGFIVLRPTTELIGVDQQLLRLTGQSFALQLLLQRGTLGSEAPLHSALLDELISLTPGDSRQTRHLEQHLGALGMNLSEPHVLLLIRPEGGAFGRALGWASSYASAQGGLRTVRDGCVKLLLPGTASSDVARAVGAELTALLGQPVTVAAAGPRSGLREVGLLHSEATRCMEALTTLETSGAAASLDDLGFIGLLLSETHNVGGFVESIVGPVLDYDREQGSELLRTLEAYFAVGTSPSRAAAALHVHPNTVSRRLERVTQLLGEQWQQPDRMLDIQLALRIHRMRSVLRLDSSGQVSV
ncbi:MULTISPECIES: helix-turn-helix domain-containing protein [Streptomyces]|uniref:Helix-turn-helix domain-containing protein n=1 Tax=Streptomyces evansiae TaxID=3075535 RepID=A0ABU2QYQ9_9ACTN|nr:MULTISPECIES: helix-turn-helix domain-containing protein [unclassified Streptomyces]MDT0409583.1 helix-turn-helix domain-containing protein [Streptomyces sp. DSM 41979]MYQ57031.1 GAF domain-containing protein [Streptomyces sp. SID4926]SCE53794.1 GAF domain-containing protein [Streptomyces sp. DfronAA-171]